MATWVKILLIALALIVSGGIGIVIGTLTGYAVGITDGIEKAPGIGKADEDDG